VNGSNCMSLWDETYEGIPPWLPPPRPNSDVEIGSAGYAVRNSVMERFTQHNPKPCLTDDDVEALATLYPDCSVASHSVNSCSITLHNIGLVRLMIYAILPLLIALILIILFSSIVHWYHQAELKKTRHTLENTKLALAVSRLQAAKDRTVEQIRRQGDAMASFTRRARLARGSSSRSLRQNSSRDSVNSHGSRAGLLARMTTGLLWAAPALSFGRGNRPNTNPSFIGQRHSCSDLGQELSGGEDSSSRGEA